MASKKVTPRRIGVTVKRAIVAALKSTDLSVILLSQAIRRVEGGGDSTHRYPPLAADKMPGHWRQRSPEQVAKGEGFLQDTGKLLNGLTSKQTVSGDTIRVSVLTDELYPVYHQHGFKTKGPNFIPLTQDAKDRYPEFAAITARGKEFEKEAEAKGFFRSGPKRNYFMAWRGVTVPQRKIVNMAPENVAEFQGVISDIIRKAAA